MKNVTKRLFSGIRQKHVNEIVWNIYGYKFYGNKQCFVNLCYAAVEDLRDIDFDVIVPIQPRNSDSDIVPQLAVQLGEMLRKQVLDILTPGNSNVSERMDLRGKTVLIVDDVIYTGRTSAKAEKALRKLKPSKILFYALAKSKNNKM